MRIAAACLGLIWLIVILPAWLIGIGLGEEVVLLPRADLSWPEWLVVFLILYAPPILGLWAIWATVVKRRFKRESSNFHASN